VVLSGWVQPEIPCRFEEFQPLLRRCWGQEWLDAHAWWQLAKPGLLGKGH